MLFLHSLVLVIMRKRYEFNIPNPSDCIIAVQPLPTSSSVSLNICPLATVSTSLKKLNY